MPTARCSTSTARPPDERFLVTKAGAAVAGVIGTGAPYK
jgi:hypothetical protein